MHAHDRQDPIYEAEVADISGTDHTFSTPTRYLLVGTAGDIVVRLAGADANVTIPSLVAGICHPLAVEKVIKTGTSAVDIVGGW